MKYHFEYDASRCVDCGACAAACMDQNDLYPEKGDIAYRRSFTKEENIEGQVRMTYLSVGCMHCDDAPCMAACPCDCFYKDGETSFVLYDNESCVSCGQCQDACLNDAIVFPRNEKMEKCDGCVERVKKGLLPACVKVCPFDALKLRKE